MAQEEAHWLAKVAVLVVVGGVFAYAVARRSAEPKPETTPAPLPCLLTVRSTRQGPYVFPTQEGLVAWDEAVMRQASAADLQLVLLSSHVTQADWRAGCVVLDSGISHSKIRVTTGTNAGTEGWVPTSQTLGN